jgi:hypothetical protein
MTASCPECSADIARGGNAVEGEIVEQPPADRLGKRLVGGDAARHNVVDDRPRRMDPPC